MSGLLDPIPFHRMDAPLVDMLCNIIRAQANLELDSLEPKEYEMLCRILSAEN